MLFIYSETVLRIGSYPCMQTVSVSLLFNFLSHCVTFFFPCSTSQHSPNLLFRLIKTKIKSPTYCEAQQPVNWHSNTLSDTSCQDMLEIWFDKRCQFYCGRRGGREGMSHTAAVVTTLFTLSKCILATDTASLITYVKGKNFLPP